MAWLEDFPLKMPLNQAVKSRVAAAINRSYSAEVVSCLGEPVTFLLYGHFGKQSGQETSNSADRVHSLVPDFYWGFG